MKILIADDHAIVRRGLQEVLSDAFRNAEFGVAENGQQVLEAVWKQKWDLLILDVTMPGRSGLDILRDIKQASPGLPVLVVSAHPEDQYALRVLKAGASGYLSKEKATEELVDAVQKVLAGGHFVTTSLAEKLAASFSAGNKSPHERLSDREFQVLKLLGAGKTVKEIASNLSLSVQTISTHRAHILEKMSLHTTAELVRYAVENKLVD